MKKTLVLFGASALLYSCSPKVSGSVADSSSNNSKTTSQTESSNTQKLNSGNTANETQAATAIPSK
jgi:hypothetical protein